MPRYFKREGRGKGYEDVTREVAALREKLTWYEGAVPSVAEMQALRAELARMERERDAERIKNRAMPGWRDRAERAEAELERVTTERDDAYALIRHYADTDPEVALAERMRHVVEAAGNAVDADRQMYHGAHEHAEANMEATFTALQDAVDAYRTTSEQEADDA